MRNKSFLVSQRYQCSKMVPCTSGALLHKSVYQIYLLFKNLSSCQPLLRSWTSLSSSNPYREWTTCLFAMVSTVPFFLFFQEELPSVAFQIFSYLFSNFSFITNGVFDYFFDHFSIFFFKKEKRNL